MLRLLCDTLGRFRNVSRSTGGISMRVIKKGQAMRVIFFYPGEEGTYIENANVTLYENGIVHIRSSHEETTTHLQSCEILWNFEVEKEDRITKVRLLKIKESEAKNLKSPLAQHNPVEQNPEKP